MEDTLEIGKSDGVLTKSEHLSRLLEAKIGQEGFALDQKFLSTHDITRQYKVSAGTARKALANLVDKGYLRSERGSGHYLQKEVIPPAVPTAKRPDRSTEIATAIMAVVGSPGLWGRRRMEEYLAAIEQACLRQGWSLLRARNEADDIEQVAKDKQVAGYLAFGVDGPLAGEIDPAMVITWGGSQPHPASAIMGIDQESMSRLAYEHLSDLGHQRMAMVRPMAWESPEEEARKGGGAILGMRKVYADLRFSWGLEHVVRVEPREVDRLYQRLRDAGVTGVFSEDLDITMELYRQAHRLGESLGDRLSLVTSGGFDMADMMHPRPARVFWRAVDYAAVVVKAIRRLEDGTPLPPRLFIPVFLESGPSARPPRQV